MLHLKHFISHTIIELRYTPGRKTIKKKKKKYFLVNFPSNYFQIKTKHYKKHKIINIQKLQPQFIIKKIEEKIKEKNTAITNK